ncbi:MAG: hypothetical protein ACE5PV_00710 [Candidatus Poribacteria bacterium]
MEEIKAASEEEIASDVEKAIQAVRAKSKKKEYSVMVKNILPKVILKVAA